jgi:5-methyltetrahydrofolate--homocysteine methyltransferase
VTEELTHAVVELREDDTLAMVDRLLAEGADPAAILADCKRAMDVIGERFACGEAFIPELIMAGEIMQGVADRLKPHMAAAAPDERLGTVVLGTVAGDIHDIGKDIVGAMLDIAGFEVIDLGVDVPVATFVDTARERGADIVAMSCLLTSAFEAMRQTAAAVGEAGLRPATRVMVGGAPMTEGVCEYTGADGWGADAVEAVELAKRWMGGA